MPANPALLIVTDLDGTLLDHETYSVDAARPALNRLRELQIPVIFNTSKTRIESQLLGESLGLSDPFIIENGSAICFPKRRFSVAPGNCRSASSCWLVELGSRHEAISKQLDSLAARFDFRPLSRMDVQTVMDRTGLGMTATKRAQQREYSEAIVWEDSDEALEQFRQTLADHGLHLLQGGRFWHVLGDTDKGRALQALRDAIPEYADSRIAALGDSQNDVAMLESADIAAIIRSPAHPAPSVHSQRPPLYSQACGPAGWAECVDRILQDFTMPRRGDHHG